MPLRQFIYTKLILFNGFFQSGQQNFRAGRIFSGSSLFMVRAGNYFFRRRVAGWVLMVFMK